MKSNSDKHLEQLVDKMMKEVPLEKPSLNFTSNVMTKVLESKMNSITEYKPLISKKVWVLIFIGILSLLVYASLSGAEVSKGLFSTIDFSFLSSFDLSGALTSLHFSKTTVYACVLLAVMLLVQIPILNRYADRHLKL